MQLTFLLKVFLKDEGYEIAKECHTYENNVIIEELIFRGCL